MCKHAHKDKENCAIVVTTISILENLGREREDGLWLDIKNIKLELEGKLRITWKQYIDLKAFLVVLLWSALIQFVRVQIKWQNDGSECRLWVVGEQQFLSFITVYLVPDVKLVLSSCFPRCQEEAV